MITKAYTHAVVVDTIYCVMKMIALMKEDPISKQVLENLFNDMIPAKDKDSRISANSLAFAPKILEMINLRLAQGPSHGVREANLSEAFEEYKLAIQNALKRD